MSDGDQKYDTTAIGWVNTRKSKAGNPYITVKFGKQAAGLVIREGLTLPAFKRENDHGVYYMLCIDNDVMEEIRIDSISDVPDMKPTKPKTDDAMNFDGDDDPFDF